VKKLLLSTAMALGLYALVPAPSAHAQTAGCGVNYVPAVGINCANIRAKTYSAAILKLVPAATPTDFFCISGSATKAISVRRIEIGATGTGLTQPIYLNHNLGLDTGTAAVAATYGPIAYPLNSANPAATAVVVAYNTTGGNPTIGGTVTTIRSSIILSALATTPVTNPTLIWQFGTSVDAYSQGLDIPSGATTEQYCLNYVGGTAPSTVNGYIEWTEN
jgi:hypothetical protein